MLYAFGVATDGCYKNLRTDFSVECGSQAGVPVQVAFCRNDTCKSQCLLPVTVLSGECIKDPHTTSPAGTPFEYSIAYKCASWSNQPIPPSARLPRPRKPLKLPPQVGRAAGRAGRAVRRAHATPSEPLRARPLRASSATPCLKASDVIKCVCWSQLVTISTTVQQSVHHFA